jgi:uncharacterized protein YqeY
MTLHESLRISLKEAMKDKDKVRLSVIRNILGSITNELVATKRTPQDILPDKETLQVIKRLSKQRQEAIVQYEAADRTEQAAAEASELAILQNYLPQTMSVAEITPIAEAKKQELGLTDSSQIGRLIGAVKQELGDQAEGNEIKKAVDSLF